jgi:hypothetical protein
VIAGVRRLLLRWLQPDPLEQKFPASRFPNRSRLEAAVHYHEAAIRKTYDDWASVGREYL